MDCLNFDFNMIFLITVSKKIIVRIKNLEVPTYFPTFTKNGFNRPPVKIA